MKKLERKVQETDLNLGKLSACTLLIAPAFSGKETSIAYAQEITRFKLQLTTPLLPQMVPSLIAAQENSANPFNAFAETK